MSKNHQGGVSRASHISVGCIQDPTQFLSFLITCRSLILICMHCFRGQKLVQVVKLKAVWYIRSPLSHNLLGQLMKCISADASLSCIYTVNLDG